MNDVAKWTPRSLLPSSFDRFFDEYIPRIFESPVDFNISVDIQETDENLLVKAELPGLEKEDISIEMDDAILTISGEKKIEKVDNESKIHRSEITYGKFQRSFHIPIRVKHDEITASFKDGVLHITLPKTEVEKTRKISIG